MHANEIRRSVNFRQSRFCRWCAIVQNLGFSLRNSVSLSPVPAVKGKDSCFLNLYHGSSCDLGEISQTLIINHISSSKNVMNNYQKYGGVRPAPF